MNARWGWILGVSMLLSGIACGVENSSPPQGGSPKESQKSPEKKEASQPTATRYKVNPAKSHMTAQVGVGGMLKSLGHPHLIALREVQGEAETASQLVGPATIHLRFATGSAEETSKEFDEKDRQKVNTAVRQEALETARFPEVVFKSRKVEVKESGEHLYAAAISGDLTLHGVTHEVSFPAKVSLQGKSLRAEGSFTILHSTYGIKRLSAAGGTIKAKDEIVLSFDIQADPD